MPSKKMFLGPLMALAVATLLIAPGCGSDDDGGSSTQPTASRKNILVIVADDLGYSDLGAYGSEIDTPNIDSLARAGVQMTDFHAQPVCSLTRASLLTGSDHHVAGLGTMAEQQKAPNQVEAGGYEGYLTTRVVTVASLLRDAGYHTYMAGKWHLGLEEHQGPAARGFEESYVLLGGGASHLDQTNYNNNPEIAQYRENGRLVDLPEGFFSTEFYTDRTLEYIDKNHGDGQPFFAYVAYTAPHWPLQAPDDWIDRYAGRYDEGYEAIRAERLARMKQLGLVASDLEASPWLGGVKPWDQLTAEEQQVEARKMEIFAGMVANMDYHIGRLIDHLKEIGEYDNTLIVFISDNGPSADNISGIWSRQPGGLEWAARTFDNSLQNMGRVRSFVYLNTAWGQVGSTPSRLYKGYTAEGGIRVPAIVKYPGMAGAGTVSSAFATVLDLAPTALDVAGVTHPTTYEGRTVQPMIGESMLPFLNGETARVHSDNYLAGWDFQDNRAVRKGQWKLVGLFRNGAPYTTSLWQLYNLETDPTESIDLAESEPEKMTEMFYAWDEYVYNNMVTIAEWPVP